MSCPYANQSLSTNLVTWPTNWPWPEVYNIREIVQVGVRNERHLVTTALKLICSLEVNQTAQPENKYEKTCHPKKKERIRLPVPSFFRGTTRCWTARGGGKKSSISFSSTPNLNEPQRNQVTNLFVCLWCFFSYLTRSRWFQQILFLLRNLGKMP